MGFNLGIRISPKRGVRVTKSISAGRVLLWSRKGKVKASVRTK
jgi:hypothetical protein